MTPVTANTPLIENDTRDLEQQPLNNNNTSLDISSPHYGALQQTTSGLTSEKANGVSDFSSVEDDYEDLQSQPATSLLSDNAASLRIIALRASLVVNLLITLTKLVTYLHTLSLSVLAALLDSVLDVVSQLVLNYTEKHSSLERSSAVYPAGAR
jgi:hypothetical protein